MDPESFADPTGAPSMSKKRDYYEVLVVGREASGDEIKSAYRKIALKNHPDRNPGDAAAEATFKEAAEAYAVLSDPQKRSRYDQYGHAGVDGAAGGSGFGSVEDIFSQFGDLFGGAGGIFEQFFGGGGGGSRRRKGATLRVDLSLTLQEVATGAKRSVEINRPETCDTCEGSGAKPGTEPERCQTCGGAGQVAMNQGIFSFRQACPNCGGEGVRIESPCTDCKGEGRKPRKVPIDLSIPAGIEDGTAQRIRGQGEPGDRGAPPGDLVVVIRVEPHEFFTRAGDDLLAQTKVRFRQAVVGDTIEVPTIHDETVSLKIPPGTQPGTRLKLRNQGLPRVDGYGRGNLVVQVQIDVPTKIDDEQRELLEKFDELESKKKPHKGKKRGILEKVRDILHGS